jgi:hypothetical protein
VAMLVCAQHDTHHDDTDNSTQPYGNTTERVESDRNYLGERRGRLSATFDLRHCFSHLEQRCGIIPDLDCMFGGVKPDNR